MTVCTSSSFLSSSVCVSFCVLRPRVLFTVFREKVVNKVPPNELEDPVEPGSFESYDLLVQMTNKHFDFQVVSKLLTSSSFLSTK